MLQRRLAVGTILFVGMLHVPAVLHYWYFFFWWYDVMMHALGGLAMGFVACTLWTFLHSQKEETIKDILLQMIFVLGFVALIGIGWEWTEGLADAFVFSHVSSVPAQLGLTDTMLDLYFDLFGGFVAWLIIRSIPGVKK